MAFDRIGACAAVLDGDGIIVATNGSWRLFADLNGGDAVTSGLGVNYLDVCDRAATAGIDGAAQTATGLRQILSGERERMDVEYPCSSPNEERWFLLQASAVSYADGEGVVLFHVDITTRKLQAERLAALAADDPLIGLPTRRAAVEHLGRQLTTTGTRAGSVWVHLIDVDHLRTVNEQHGHHVGDELLCRVARRAQHGLRGQGHLYRFGGDELVLISSGVDRVGAVSMAARLRALMDEPFQIEGIAVVGRVSVGLAGNEPGSTADSVLVAAGEDLDRAKRERADRRPGEQWGAHPATGRGEHAATDPVVDVADVLADLDSLIGAEAPGTLPGLTVVAEHLVVLERTAARYRTLVDHLPGTAVMVFDRDLCILVVAGPGTRLWRYAERGVAPGRYLRDILGPEELAVLEPFYRSALVAPGSLEYHSVTTGLDFHFAAVPVPNLDGEVDQLLVTVTDVTQAKADAEALREAERRYRTAFEEGPVGMAQTTLNGRFEGVNQALCDLTGYTADELGARTSMSITHDDDLEREDAARSSMIDGRSDVYRAEKRLLHADGEYIWVAVSIAVVRDGVRPLYFLHHFLDITDRKHIEAQLQHLADHDPLTGLANRRGFEAALGRHVSAVARYGYSGALLVLDLDHFKQINDTLGHRAGDELIVSLASVVRRRLRDTDIVGRLGGDEFAVLLPHVTQEQAEVVATSLLEAVRTEVTVLAGTHRRKVTTSIGIAAFDDPRLSGAELLVSADLAMYDAKEAGRDRYAVHEPSNTEPTTRARLAWVDRIIDALDHDRFTLFAQPIMHLATRRITRYELLLRMIDDDGEIISPATFLSVAEKFG
ncbi:MAG: diguanylate cyclase, partial [Ilumatobacteraceae bacterium]